MKNFKKITKLVLTIALSVGVLTGCNSDKTETNNENVETTGSNNVIKTSDKEYDDYVVKVVNNGGLCVAPIQMAYEKGFFEEEGVKVEMIKGSGTSQDLIASGKADVAQDMLPNTVLRIDNGLDINISMGVHTGCLSMMVSPDSDIKKVEDLKGKRIGVSSLGGSEMAIAQRALADVGVSTSADNMEVEFVAFSGPELAMVLEDGTVDAVVAGDPLSQNIVREGIGEIIFSNTDHPDYKDEYCCILSLSPYLVQNHPVAAERITKAIQKATKFVGENPEETAKIQVEKDYIPKDDIEHYSNIIKSYHWGGSVDGGRDGLRNNMVDLRKLDLIKSDMDIEKVIDKVYVQFENVEDNIK